MIIAIGIAQIPIFARLLRGSMMAQRSSDHVLAARALGVPRSKIVLRHMLPNSLSPVLVQATMVLATSIVDAAALSYIGAGNPDDSSPEWGQMLGRAQDLFDAYLPLARYEQQPGIGLAVRKHILTARGVITSAHIRRPGPALSAADIDDIARLTARQQRRLAQLGA